MTKNFDELLPLAHGADDGQDTAASVQPIVDDEMVWPDVSNRPTENLRVRTEILRRALESANYFHDYDRGLILRADAKFTFSMPAAGRYELALGGTGSSLWVYPALTPGRMSGGRNEGGVVFCANPSAAGAWTPYSGTPGSDDLILVAYRQTTGQRGYADADDIGITSAARSLGSNRIFVDLVANPGVLGGVATIVATITGAPRTHIRVVYGTNTTPTTLADIIAFINADRTSQGTYGVADFLRASSTGTTTNPPVAFTSGQVQGAYDAEAHQVTQAQLVAFFAAVDGLGAQSNRLREGEGLAIGYPAGPVETGVPSPRGGRRQSLWDLPVDRVGTNTQNTSPALGWSLFSTGREPEKIPGSIPIGKVIDGQFVFIDGTRLAPGETLDLGESRTTYAVLASTDAGIDGSRLVGYAGSGAWHADAGGTTSPQLPAATVNSSLSRIVADIARSTASQSGARRLGSEAVTGDSSLGNDAFIYNFGQGSLRQQLLDLLVSANGLNRRVHEEGHRMRGANPLHKDFGAGDMPAAGARFIESTLHAPANLYSAIGAGVQEFRDLDLQPFIYVNPGDAADYLAAAEVGAFSSATELHFTGMSLTRFGTVFAKIPLVPDADSSTTVPLVWALITGTAGAASAPEGLYSIVSRNTGTGVAAFRKLDGSAPDFTGMSGSAAVTFLCGFLSGNDRRYIRRHGFHFNGFNNWPWMAMGASGVNARLLDTYVPGGGGAFSLRVYPDRVEFHNGTKTTESLLSSADYDMLKGYERGTVVDADVSHRHGGYSRTVFLDPPHQDAALDTVAFSAWTGAPVTITLGDTVPAGTKRTGAIFDVYVIFQPDALVTAGTSCTFALRVDNGATKFVMVRDTIIQRSDGAVDVKYVNFQVHVPVNSTNHHISVWMVTATSVNTTLSTVTMTQVGQILESIDH